MNNKQLSIPGLEDMVKAKTNADTKQATFQEQLKALQDRALHLELEVSLLQILVENPKENKQY